MKKIGIYIHIPFCSSKCNYCDFVSFANKDELIEKYIDALCLEILSNAQILSEYDITTIYFGGGTPSYIDSKYIAKILKTLHLFLNDEILNEVETTIEINPNSINEYKINEYKNNGVDRVSIGLQTTHDEILKLIGRAHTLKDFENALTLCKNNKIENISIDLMYPLPMLKLSQFEHTLTYIMNMSQNFNIKHISIYNLEVHKNTKLAFLLNEGYVNLPDEDEEYEMKEMIENVLNLNDYEKYEISNWCKAGYASKHNTSYWNQEIYLGFGVAASSFFLGSRYKNTDNIEEYIKLCNANLCPVSSITQLDKFDLMKEYIILKLRLKLGVNINEFFKKFGVDIFSLFNTQIDILMKDKLLIRDKNNIFLSKRGCEVANLVWQKFI